MKRVAIFLLLLLVATDAWAVRTRPVRWLSGGYSVHLHALENPNGQNFWKRLDSMVIRAGGMQADIDFQFFSMNGSGIFDSQYLISNGWYGSGSNPPHPSMMRILYQHDIDPNGGSNGLIRWYDRLANGSSSYLTPYTGTAKPTLKNIFSHHPRAYLRADSLQTANFTTWEKYDIVSIKQPYRQWRDFNQTHADRIFLEMQKLRDSVSKHPEVTFVFNFGTPLTFSYTDSDGEANDDDFDGDTLQARYVYELAGRVRTEFITNYDPDGPYKNFHVIEFYQALCERDAGSYNRYCLDDALGGGSGAASHLTEDGSEIFQDSMLQGIARITRWYMTYNRSDTRHKTNTGSDPGWPGNIAQANWPAGVTSTAATRDSIKNYQAQLIASRYVWTTNGAPEQMNRIKALKPTFRRFEYNSFQDNYTHSAGDLSENDYLAAWAASHGQNYEQFYLHYWDTTTINLQGVDVTVPGVRFATSLADSTASRLFVYYANKSRCVPDYSKAWVREATIAQVTNRLTVPQDGYAYPPDGIFWDNSQPNFYNVGTIVSGGTVAEHPTHAFSNRIGIPGASPGDSWWYTAHMKPFFQQLMAVLDTLAGGTKHIDLNTSGTIYDPLWQDHLGDGFGHEGTPASTRQNNISQLYTWAQNCEGAGIGLVLAPAVYYDAGGIGTQTFTQAMHNNYALFLVVADDSSSFTPLTSANTSNFEWDTLVWIPSFSNYLGEMETRDAMTIVQTGTDAAGQSYNIFRRKITGSGGVEGATILSRPKTLSSQTNMHDSTAVTYALGGNYRELLADGSFAQPVTTTTLKLGQGRIFVPIGTVAATNVNGVTISAVCNDCNGSTEADNFTATVSTGTEVLTGATVQVIYSTTAQPSSWTSPLTAAYTPSSNIVIPINNVDGLEDYTLYVAARLLKSDQTTTTPVYATIFNNNITPSLLTLSVVNTASNPAGTPDQFTVSYSTPNNGTLDGISFGFSTTSFAAITAPSTQILYRPNFSGTLSHSGDYAEPYTLYVKGWLLENGEYTPTPLQASVAVGTGPPSITANKNRIKGAVRIKGNVRIK